MTIQEANDTEAMIQRLTEDFEYFKSDFDGWMYGGFPPGASPKFPLECYMTEELFLLLQQLLLDHLAAKAKETYIFFKNQNTTR